MAIFNSKLLVYQRVKWTQQILTGADRLRAQWARGRRGTTWHNPHQKYVSCSAPPRKLDFLMCQIVSNICDSAVESRHPMCFFGISIILCHHMFGEGAKKSEWTIPPSSIQEKNAEKIRNHHHPSSHFQRTPFRQWIGFLGKILTGNHRFSHEDYGAFRLKFSLKPIHWFCQLPFQEPKSEVPTICKAYIRPIVPPPF